MMQQTDIAAPPVLRASFAVAAVTDQKLWATAVKLAGLAAN